MFNKLILPLLLTFLFVACSKNNSTTQSTKANTSLSDLLKEKAAESAKKMPTEAKAIMQKASKELIESNILSKALKKGDTLPEFTLTDVKRGSVSSKELLKKGPLVISFYRGGWCPYCNLQLRDLQQHLPEIKSAGAELVAISPEKPDNTQETIKKNDLQFYVLSDANGTVGKQFGLVFTMNQELIGLYKKFGINLEENNNSNKWELPLAATYIVNKEGKIAYSFIDTDYTKRAETKELINILKSL